MIPDVPRLYRGSGWRVGWNPERQPFCALLGTDDWALELTQAEWQDFRVGLDQVLATLEAVRSQLVDQEAITLEHTTPNLKVALTGDPDQVSLYLQVLTGRGGEGYWTAAAIPELVDRIRRLSS